MATIVRVPALGAAIANVTILRWAIDEGGPVERGATLLEVETDKMNMDIPAERPGVLHRILVDAGTETEEGRPLAVIGDADEQVDELVARALSELGTPPDQATATEARPVAADSEPVSPADDATTKRRVTPVARRVAKELGVDIAMVTPSGGSRAAITKDDVLHHHAATQTQPGAGPTSDPIEPAAASRTASVLTPDGDVEIIPLVGARKVLAERMAESARSAPHFTMMLEVDCVQLVAARDALQREFEREVGAKLTYMPFIVKAIARAVDEVPIVNATLEGEEIHVHKTANVAFAVAVEDVILVPVVQRPIGKSIIEIGAEIDRLTRSARARKLGPEDSANATITLSNVGATEIVSATTILSPPQVAMIAVTRIIDRVVPINGAITVRPQLNSVFTYDHRVVQGVPGARFAERVKGHLEHQLDS